MATKFKNRMASEQGFTLIELLVVIVILGILVAIAVPSYLAFRGNAEQAAAQSNVRSAIPAAEGYYQTNSSYALMDTAALTKQAPGVQVTDVNVSLDKNAYCLDFVKGQHAAFYIGGDQGVNAAGDGFQALAAGTPVSKVIGGAIGAGTDNTCAGVGATAGS
jgi:prepilin-type N-terminal cleavage/methylation domain-containing protein